MPHLTSSELPLLSAVVGGVIALVSARALRGRDAKEARVEARGRAVEEALAASDDLLGGVRLYRTVRGGRAHFRALATGMQRAEARWEAQQTGRAPSFQETLGLAAVELLSAASAGGLVDQVMDQDATHYQVMVVPSRQRLTAAVASLRVGEDRELADAADSLVRAGGVLADEASSLPRAFRRAEKEFSRRVQVFREVGVRGPKRRLRWLKR